MRPGRTISATFCKENKQMTRAVALPFNLPPRMLSREAAAAYAGVSPGTFTKMIAEGTMPKARKLSGRRIAWDVRELDRYLDRLAHDDDADETTETDSSEWD